MDNEEITGPRNNFEILSVWNYLQSLVHVGWMQRKVTDLKPNEKNKEFEIFHISQVMSNYPTKKILQSQSINYNNMSNNREIPNYLRERNAYFPNSTTNFPERQNVYRAPMKHEGFAVRNRNYQNFERKVASNSTFKNNNSNKSGDFERKFLKHRESDEKLKKSKLRYLHSCMKKSEIASITKQYCQTSTLHGLRYIGDSNLSVFERLFWIISFTAAVATAGLHILGVYKKWISSPIIISLSPEPVAYEEFPFPSITLCNMNNAKKSEADRIKSGSDKLEKILLNDICNNENFTTFNDIDDESAKWVNVRRFMINVSQSCTEMLHYCQWHGLKFECEKLFNPTMTDEGMCCNFNSVHRNFIFFNPKESTDLNVTYPFPIIDWTPETGYTSSNVTPDSVPWRPYGAGKYFGLTLSLDANVDEYYCSSTASVGFKMLLHNPVETPKIADFAFAISPGKETRIIIRPHISVASKTILKIPKKKRKCFFTSERRLRFYRTYTQRNCFLECEANFTQQICQCVQYYMPKSLNTKICGKKDDQCAIQARRAMEQKLYDDENANSQLNITETPSCNCWPGCFEVSYTTEISQSALMANYDIEDIYVRKDKNYFVNNMAVVHLFFVDSQFTKNIKTELFGFTEFLSNIGGLLGLFMGFSVLSFMEIIYFLTLRFWCQHRKNRNSLNHSEVETQIQQNNHVTYPFAH